MLRKNERFVRLVRDDLMKLIGLTRDAATEQILFFEMGAVPNPLKHIQLRLLFAKLKGHTEMDKVPMCATELELAIGVCQHPKWRVIRGQLATELACLRRR